MDIKSFSTAALMRQDVGGSVGRTLATNGASPGGAGTAAAVSTTGSAATGGAATGAASNGVGTAQGTSRLVYLSPFAQFDPKSHLEILQFREPGTGKVTMQIPPEKVVEAYRRMAAYSQAPQTDVSPRAQAQPQTSPQPASITPVGAASDQSQQGATVATIGATDNGKSSATKPGAGYLGDSLAGAVGLGGDRNQPGQPGATPQTNAYAPLTPGAATPVIATLATVTPKTTTTVPTTGTS